MDSDIANMARGLLSEYSETHLLLKSFEKSCGKTLREVFQKLKTDNGLKAEDISPVENRNLQELLNIVSFGIESGADVRNALAVFAKRVERNMVVENRIKAKVGSSQTLTYLGMSIFFPLFSGISALILSSSLSLIDKSALLVYRSFLILTISYIPIILYLTSAFSHPERSLEQNALSIIPYLALAVCIIYASEGYLAKII